MKKVFQKDINSIYVWGNKEYAKDHNIKSEDIAGKTDFELYSDEQAEKFRQDDKRIMKLGKLEDIEEEYSVDGKTHVVYTTKIPIRKKNGKIIGILGIFWDSAEERNKEQKIQESEEAHRLLYETSSDAIMTLEPPEWSFTSGNPATLKMFGAKTEEEFVAIGPQNVSPEKQSDGRLSSVKAKAMIEKALQDGSNLFEWTHKKINGSVFEATVLLTKVEAGSKTFLQATVRDISMQKKDEAKINKNLKKLEKFNELMTGRELKMVELKKEIVELKAKLDKQSDEN